MKVGDQVVCIKKGPWKCWTPDPPPLTRYPEYGCVYTIAGIREIPHIGPCVRLEGFEREWKGRVPSWAARFFRPVVRTDISVFKEMLAPIKELVHEKA